MSGCRAPGNGMAVGCGSPVVGRRRRVMARFGSADIGNIAPTSASGSAGTGVDSPSVSRRFPFLKILKWVSLELRCRSSPGQRRKERSVMKKLTLTRTLLVALGLPILAGCATPTHTMVYSQPATRGETSIVQHPTEPPPVPSENIPQPPDNDYIWVKGAWEWHGGRWVWVPGHWEQPHP